jgi:hypothetical protein
MRLRTLGLLTALTAAFIAGTKAGVEYAKGHYVSRDRKFIDGEVVKSNKEES